VDQKRTTSSLASEAGCHDLATGPTEGKQLVWITCMAPKKAIADAGRAEVSPTAARRRGAGRRVDGSLRINGPGIGLAVVVNRQGDKPRSATWVAGSVAAPAFTWVSYDRGALLYARRFEPNRAAVPPTSCGDANRTDDAPSTRQRGRFVLASPKALPKLIASEMPSGR
jgi:hypothetical protein